MRIPLRDVVRFKERQWFIEEIEVRCICIFEDSMQLNRWSSAAQIQKY